MEIDVNLNVEFDLKGINTQKELQEPKPVSIVHIMQFCAGSVILNVRYFEEKRLYKILISKNGEYFFPKETKLEALTCEYLCQLLEIEFRGEELQYFVGFENRRKFKRIIEEIPQYFTDCP